MWWFLRPQLRSCTQNSTLAHYFCPRWNTRHHMLLGNLLTLKPGAWVRQQNGPSLVSFAFSFLVDVYLVPQLILMVNLLHREVDWISGGGAARVTTVLRTDSGANFIDMSLHSILCASTNYRIHFPITCFFAVATSESKFPHSLICLKCFLRIFH